jgi:hypothetical protein
VPRWTMNTPVVNKSSRLRANATTRTTFIGAAPSSEPPDTSASPYQRLLRSAAWRVIADCRRVTLITF